MPVYLPLAPVAMPASTPDDPCLAATAGRQRPGTSKGVEGRVAGARSGMSSAARMPTNGGPAARGARHVGGTQGPAMVGSATGVTRRVGGAPRAAERPVSRARRALSVNLRTLANGGLRLRL